MHPQTLPQRMSPAARAHAHRRSTRSGRWGKALRHPPDAFADTLPSRPPLLPRRERVPRLNRSLLGALSTYLVSYGLVFVVTLTVLLLTTDLTLALDVVTLVAREALWFSPIVGTVLVWAPWRRNRRQHQAGPTPPVGRAASQRPPRPPRP